MAKRKLIDLYNSQYYIPRDLSWLEFNRRVLQEGLDANVPLAERLKFLAITSSNLDEFFKVRVAGARQQAASSQESKAAEAADLLDRISKRAHQLVESQSKGILEVFSQLRRFGIRIQHSQELDDKSKEYLRSHFEKDILPILTPLAVEDMTPSPLLPALQLHIALLLRIPAHFELSKTFFQTPQVPSEEEEYLEKLAVIPVPTQLSRWILLSQTEEQSEYVFLEQMIAANADLLFPGCEILASSVFRITRDEDVLIQEDFENYAKVVEDAVLSRRRREAVRLELLAKSDSRIVSILLRQLHLRKEDVYEQTALLDATVLMELADHPRLKKERYEEWFPVTPRDLMDCEDIWDRVSQEDVLLFHPYEKFTPVVELLEKAALDPDVLAIKQTLYRTSGDSPIVKALTKAAKMGKEVSVLVELRARFDESRNIQWTRQLEDAGCHVIYGISGYKTHAKAMLIIRRERGRIRRYVHLATGNYNDKTARIYSDLGLMTCHPEMTADVAAFFNLLTGYSEAVGWKRLTVEPVLLKRRFIELIEREMAVSTPEQPGRIRAKLNALEDKNVIEALYRASRHGVKIALNIRGICCLRPGLKGISENITVRSIIDRYLEHARIFHFHNGGSPEVYLASSDWMTRNLEHRLEILFPILSPGIQQRILHMLDVYLSDNQKSQQLKSDGRWSKVMPQEGMPPIRAQEIFHWEAEEQAMRPSHPPLRYIPLKRPDNDE
ncbi:MAG: polyphosphate kinase 1 [Planctomycetia bacterium]|nr:polyphosphate kinase 1 [Planctomycetia bacterium]